MGNGRNRTLIDCLCCGASLFLALACGSTPGGGGGEAATGGAGGEPGSGGSGGATKLCAPGSWDHDKNPDTDCKTWTVCMPGTYILVPGTATSDQTCEECAKGTFNRDENQDSCTPWTECPQFYRPEQPPTETTDYPCVPRDWVRQFGSANSEQVKLLQEDANGDVIVVVETGLGIHKTQVEKRSIAGGGVIWSETISADSTIGLEIDQQGATHLGYRRDRDTIIERRDSDGKLLGELAVADKLGVSFAIDSLGRTVLALSGEPSAVETYAPDGNLVQSYQLAQNDGIDRVHVSADDSIYSTGKILEVDDAHTAHWGYWVSRRGKTGTDWSVRVNPTPSSDELLLRSEVDPQGNVFLYTCSGDFAHLDSCQIRRLGPNGSESWAKDISPETQPNDPYEHENFVEQAGHLLLSYSLTVEPGRDDLVIKSFDTSNGTLEWTHTLSTGSPLVGFGKLTRNGGDHLLMAGGVFYGSLPGYTNQGGVDAFVARVSY